MNVRSGAVALLCIAYLAGLSGCGIEGVFSPINTGEKVEVRVSPSYRVVTRGARERLSVQETVTEQGGVSTSAEMNSDPDSFDWEVEESNGGQVFRDAQGRRFYLAPGTPGTYHVRVTSHRHPDASAIATFVVE